MAKQFKLSKKEYPHFQIFKTGSKINAIFELVGEEGEDIILNMLEAEYADKKKKLHPSEQMKLMLKFNTENTV